MTEAATEAYSRVQRPAGPPTPIAWLMGLTTCALTVGIIYWGVQLAQRDPTSLPVIRAPEGVARVEPSKPGGLKSEFDTLAVNQLQSGETPEESNIIALAPASIGLSEEDIPALIELENDAVAPVRVEIAEIDGEQIPEPVETEVASTAKDDASEAEVMMPVSAEEVEAALAEALRLAEEAVSGTPETESAELQENEAQEVEIDLAGLILAEIKEGLEDTDVEDASVETENTEEEAVAVVEEDAATPSEAIEEVLDAAQPTSANETTVGGTEVASVEAGTRLIQLGAFGSRDIARDMWKTLQTRNADLLAGRSYFIQPVESGGKTLFRLRVLGFETTADARNMCAALTDRKTPCIAVIQR